MLLMKESVLRFEEKPNFGLTTIKLPTSTKTNPLNIIYIIQYMISRTMDRVQLSISSARAYVYKYCVAMKKR